MTINKSTFHLLFIIICSLITSVFITLSILFLIDDEIYTRLAIIFAIVITIINSVILIIIANQLSDKRVLRRLKNKEKQLAERIETK